MEVDMILIEKNRDMKYTDLWIGLIRGIHKGEQYYETVPLSILSVGDGRRYTVNDYIREPYGTNTKLASDCDVVIDLTTQEWAKVTVGHQDHKITDCVAVLADNKVLARINDVSEIDSDYDLLRRAVGSQLKVYRDHYSDLPDELKSRIKFLIE
jgi:hypothetical protein